MLHTHDALRKLPLFHVVFDRLDELYWWCCDVALGLQNIFFYFTVWMPYHQLRLKMMNMHWRALTEQDLQKTLYQTNYFGTRYWNLDKVKRRGKFDMLLSEISGKTHYIFSIFACFESGPEDVRVAYYLNQYLVNFSFLQQGKRCSSKHNAMDYFARL